MKTNVTKISYITALKTMRLFACSIAVTLLVACMCFTAGCTNSTTKINIDEFPNTVVENAQISQEYKDIANQIAPQVIEEFFGITKVPHTTFHLEQITPYLQNKIIEYGAQPHVDSASGCIYADIPATNSQEWKDKPTVILQSHMDMVGKVSDQYTTFNPETMAVEAIYDQDNSTIHSKDYLTNIGADDGQGMAFMLATLKNKDNFNHGPIRLLFTANEEVGCEGARDLSADIVNGSYLINIDGYQVGNVLTSSAGTLRGVYTNNFAEISPDTTDNKITVSVSNLAGGHTGIDVVKSLLHGQRYVMEFFKQLDENNIDYKLSVIDCGKISNAYQTSLSFQFYVDKNKVDEVKQIFNQDIQKQKEQHTDEKDIVSEINVSEASNNDKCISKDDSKKIIRLLEALPEGLLVEGKISEDVPETSSAVGILNLKNGEFETCDMLRSSNNDTIKQYSTKFSEIAESNGFNYTCPSKMNGWPVDPDNTLKDIMLESYKQVGNFEGVVTATHGGLETSYFLDKNPNLKMISIGLDCVNEHMCSEIYYTNTTNMHVATVLYTLQHIS